MVEIPIIDTEGAAQTTIQYFENMRNFLVAVARMKLLTFEVSDLEKVITLITAFLLLTRLDSRYNHTI